MVNPVLMPTEQALSLITKLEDTCMEPLMFHQSGGCCDGSAPMCYPRGDFRVGKSDVKLGSIGDAPFSWANRNSNIGSTRI